jgi:hypothetical protein
MMVLNKSFKAVLRIRDVYPGSEFSILGQKGSKRFRIPDPQHCFKANLYFFVAGLAEFGTKVIFPRAAAVGGEGEGLAPGAYVRVRITGASSEVLKGQAVALTSLASEDS